MKAKIISGLLVATALAGCTSTQKINRPDGVTEYLIACVASTGWNICYNRANELCPSGYEALTEEWGFNHKETRVSCPSD